MQAVFTGLPELDGLGYRAVAAPEGGQGHLAEPELLPGFSILASSSERDVMTSLCGEAQAPIWLPRLRVEKYFMDSASGTLTVVPVIFICRPSAMHHSMRFLPSSAGPMSWISNA
jgi:hypothetical protein